MIDWLSNNAKTLKRAAGLTGKSKDDDIADKSKSPRSGFDSNASSSANLDQAHFAKNVQLTLIDTQLELIRLQAQVLLRLREELNKDVKTKH